MVDEFVNNPVVPKEESFLRLELQVADISCNLNLLILALKNKLKLLKEDGGSNLEEL